MSTREDDEWTEFHRVRMAEIPLNLATRTIVSMRRGNAFWVDCFRGFTTGFTFVTRYRWEADAFPTADPELWPDLTATSPVGTTVSIEVIVDGESRSNVIPGVGHLHLIGANASPGIAMAEWWVPRLPNESLAIMFRYDPSDDQGRAEVPFEELRLAAQRGIVVL